MGRHLGLKNRRQFNSAVKESVRNPIVSLQLQSQLPFFSHSRALGLVQLDFDEVKK